MDMKALQNLKDEYEKALREKGQEIMKGAVADFFKANPKITGVMWRQYTPYFNDGDPCVFRLGDPSFAVSKVDVEDVPHSAGEDDGESGFYSSYDFSLRDLNDRYYREHADAMRYAKEQNERVQALMDRLGIDRSVFVKAEESFQETVGGAPEDLFLAAFGDHKRVVLTPDEIFVEDYDHE